MEINDIEKKRALHIDGNNRASPQSVFISGCGGYCIEFDRQAFLEMLRQEFDLMPAAMLSLEFAA